MLAIAILAAGRGTRMKSSLPKVLQEIAGKTLIERVLDSCIETEASKHLVIIGHKGEVIKESLAHFPHIEYVEQKEQLGTGHAVQQLESSLKDFEGDLIILNGDVPLLNKRTIKNLLTKHRKTNADVSLLSAEVDNPKGYGRVFCNQADEIKYIIEDKDCTDEESKNCLINSGIYCFKWHKLIKVLPKLNKNNTQNEIYITDTIEMMDLAINMKVDDIGEIQGVNDRAQLAECEKYIQNKLIKYWMKEGITFINPESCTLSEECSIGKDTIIEPQTHIRGNCEIGEGCTIGPGSLVKNSQIGKNVTIVNSVIDSACISDNVKIGPFANIRPDSYLNENCKIGNFVEIKKSKIDIGTKVNHLTYIGDSNVGKGVNFGAGTITANYDGKNKNITRIGDYTKTGANSVLVAPLNIGNNVVIGAGSTVTKDVPADALAISRTKQITKEEWNKKKN